ncbi:MAG: transcriptional regulator with domain and aminotransferase domain [Clostridia bacterium]|jgi:DNA-binding transcriptional MocR family regulator|nr:transcriptional regulator with domain and aminotransferase domain [Clostridia bacterium]
MVVLNSLKHDNIKLDGITGACYKIKGSVIMRIILNKSSSIPIYLQIRNQIRDMILQGILEPGFRLPSERKLAETLGVNRSTVLNAYRDLKADDLIGSHTGAGTTVLMAQTSINKDNMPQKVSKLPWMQLLGGCALRMQQPLVSDILKTANRKDVISFAAGFLAQTHDPVEELLESQCRLLKDYGSTMLQYSSTQGYLPLRESISNLMQKRGITIDPEGIIVLSGSQQAIDLTARIFIDPGDVVIVEEPSFFSALQIFQSVGARIVPVPIDAKGMKIEFLESLLSRIKPKLIYTIPTFQNPSGTVMDIKRRRALLDIAYKYQIPILEDDPYGELRYEGNHLPTLKALDQHGYVIYASTFSKIMFPGMRIGWVVAEREVIRQFVLAKQMADLHTNTLGQWIMDDFLRSNVFHKRLQTVINENRESRRLMIEALKQYAIEDFEWQAPEGGLYFWCRLPRQIDPERLITKAEEKKVVYAPGKIFCLGYTDNHYIRLSFSSPPKELIKQGIKLLMQAVKETMNEEKMKHSPEASEIMPIL